jgi:hypothetical protein
VTDKARSDRIPTPLMQKLMHRMMLSCREAVRLESQAMDEPLNFGARLQLKFHRMMCKWCRRNAIQWQGIRRLTRGFSRKLTDRPDPAAPALDTEKARRLQHIIDRECSS